MTKPKLLNQDLSKILEDLKPNELSIDSNGTNIDVWSTKVESDLPFYVFQYETVEDMRCDFNELLKVGFEVV